MRRLLTAPGFRPWLLLFLGSAALHLVLLGDRPFQSDEAVHAKLAFDLVHRGTYHYDPVFHGPLLYYLVALCYMVFGDSDFTARLPIAACGIGLLVLIMQLKRPFGGKAAWFTGLLFTVSPLCLYYSRFLRMDTLELLTASACFLCGYRAMTGGNQRHWLWAAFWAGLAFSTKENAYVTAFLAAATVLLVLQAIHGMPRPGACLRAVRNHGRLVLATVSVFVVVTVPLYTFAFSHPGDWLFPVKAILYWASQHEINRIGGPWWYHLFRLVTYEFLILAAAAAWIIRRRKLRVVELALFVFGCGSLLMYAYLGEKVPWLGIHQLWAFLPLAGAQLAHTFGPRGSWWGRGAAGAALAATCVISFNANFVQAFASPYAGGASAITYAETAPELLEVVAQIPDAVPGKAAAAVSGTATWPLGWYWRRAAVQWGGIDRNNLPPLIIVDPASRRALRAELGDAYSYTAVPARYWWYPESKTPSPKELAEFLLWRTLWVRPVVNSTLVIARRR